MRDKKFEPVTVERILREEIEKGTDVKQIALDMGFKSYEALKKYLTRSGISIKDFAPRHKKK
jgi:hypothetical protein